MYVKCFQLDYWIGLFIGCLTFLTLTQVEPENELQIYTAEKLHPSRPLHLWPSGLTAYDGVAQNEEILERLTSLGGLGCIFCPIGPPILDPI